MSDRVDTFKYRTVLALFGLMGRLPAFISNRLARWLGALAFRLDRKHRGIVLDNLARAFGHEKSRPEIEAIARRVFENSAKMIFEIGWYTRLLPADIPARIRLDGFENFQQALSRGRGLFALTGHMGNWELLPAAATLADFKAAFVYRPLDSSALDLFFASQRTRFGAKMIPSARAMRKIIRHVDSGGSVFLLMDQNVDWYEGVFVDFFGHRACTNKGLAIMALKTKAPVVPVFLVREPDGYRVIFEKEIPLIDTGDPIRDVEENTRQYNEAIERIIRRYPDQWFWMHQRWKTKPWCDIADNPWKRRPPRH
ncbi:MAG: lysophospholipid acyltransferase family protein [Thermodesulfobacteriota bacterium]